MQDVCIFLIISVLDDEYVVSWSVHNEAHLPMTSSTCLKVARSIFIEKRSASETELSPLVKNPNSSTAEQSLSIGMILGHRWTKFRDQHVEANINYGLAGYQP